jgi:hypothetical protein
VLHNAKINEFLLTFSHDKDLFPMIPDGKKKRKTKKLGHFQKMTHTLSKQNAHMSGRFIFHLMHHCKHSSNYSQNFFGGFDEIEIL